LIPTFFCCLTAGPYVVVENYGNWKTLSVTAKSAYVIGLWDGFITFFEDDLLEKYNNSCSKDHITRVSDLVEVVDSLYEQEINRGYSPAILLREKGLQHICSN
jgi:hypothetical protein